MYLLRSIIASTLNYYLGYIKNCYISNKTNVLKMSTCDIFIFIIFISNCIKFSFQLQKMIRNGPVDIFLLYRQKTKTKTKTNHFVLSLTSFKNQRKFISISTFVILYLNWSARLDFINKIRPRIAWSIQ